MCKKLEYLNNYYTEVYDSKGNYITYFNNIDKASQAFNIQTKKLLYAIRNKNALIINNKKYYLYLNPKKLDYKDIKYEKRTRWYFWKLDSY